jgi:hypothetical protein
VVNLGRRLEPANRGVLDWCGRRGERSWSAQGTMSSAESRSPAWPDPGSVRRTLRSYPPVSNGSGTATSSTLSLTDARPSASPSRASQSSRPADGLTSTSYGHALPTCCWDCATITGSPTSKIRRSRRPNS